MNENVSHINLIATELEKALQPPENVGLFSIKTANQTLREAAQRPNPAALWLSLWYEGEVCCLFADSNVGKSIYAVQVATSIAQTGRKVLYFDFELSDKQFQLRYTDEQGTLYAFPPTLFRVEINKDSLCECNDFEAALIGNIEQAAVATGAKVLIIDNLTYLCIASEKGDVAGSLMMRLMNLKRQYGLSMLILAHTPKRPLTNPITQNDLAGSKKLYNFFDSAFAIGRSAKDSNLRYVKQLKVRFGNYTYDADNVIVCSIEKENAYLHFRNIGYATEREHLKEPTDSDKADLVANVKQLSAEGKTQREIAAMLNLSPASVNRYLKK